MGRGKVQLKKIENKVNRQVTFSKRKAGLLKKAHEISVLCEAQVALIVFSDNGRLVEYSTDSNMNNILERYDKYSFEERQLVANHDTQSQANWTPEYCKLKARLDLLQRNHRHYNGEDLNSVSLKDLQNLEQQLETAIKKIRTRKNQLLNDTISDLQTKANAIHEQNNMLTNKIKEKQEVVQQPPKDQQNEGTNARVLSCSPLPSLPPKSSVPPQLHCIDVGCRNEGEEATKASINEGEEATKARRNELDLTLDSLYPCHLGYFVA